MEADRKNDREEMRAGQEQIVSLPSRIEANQAKKDVNINEIGEEIKSGQAEMKSIGNAWIADMKDGRKETMACQGKTEARLECEESTSVDMEREAEYREVPKEEVAVMPVGGLRKRRRNRNLAAERRLKPTEKTGEVVNRGRD
jgi:hypothetical protein